VQYTAVSSEDKIDMFSVEQQRSSYEGYNFYEHPVIFYIKG